MSHTVTVRIEMKDRAALEAAIARVEGAQLLQGDTHRLYSSNQAHGVGVQLPGWNYPVVLNLETGEAKYDNFGGNWGAQQLLDDLAQAYGVELTRQQAMMAGRQVEEEVDQETGDIRVKIYDYAQA